MGFKNLSDTSIFKYTEKMLPTAKINSVIQKLIANDNNFVTASQMEDVFYKMRHKSFNYRAKFAVIDLYNKGVLKLVYNPSVNLTVAIPFFKFKMPNGGFGSIINITNYAKMKDGQISIDPNILYTLMLSAMIDLLYQSNATRIAFSGLPEIYSDLFINIVSRLVNCESSKRFALKYIMTKFMYMQLGFDEKRSADAASKISSRPGVELTDGNIESIDLLIPINDYENLETLINSIRNNIPEFSGITYGAVFEQWMRTYGEPSAYGIEYVPAFLTMFSSLITNCASLVNIKAIEKEANRNSSKLVMLFNTLEQIVISESSNIH